MYEYANCSYPYTKICVSASQTINNQRQYLTDIFNDGQKTGNKHDSEHVAKVMRRVKNSSNEPRFVPDEFLKGSQIKAFFSRLFKCAKSKETCPAEPEVPEEGVCAQPEDELGRDINIEETLLDPEADLLD